MLFRSPSKASYLAGISFSAHTSHFHSSMKKLRNQHILQRARDFLTAWLQFAPQDEFGKITTANLANDIQQAEAARNEILRLETRLNGLRMIRDRNERIIADKLVRFACAVRGTPAYGEDCPFYRALGFIPKSERRSGRPRKQKPSN